MKIKKNLKEFIIDQIKINIILMIYIFCITIKSFSNKKNNKLINNKIPIKE